MVPPQATKYFFSINGVGKFMPNEQNESAVYENEQAILKRGEVLPPKTNVKENLIINRDCINQKFF